MTLDDLEQHNSSYFAFFSPISIALLANYVTMVEDRPIMSLDIVSQFQSSLLLAIANPLCSAVSLR